VTAGAWLAGPDGTEGPHAFVADLEVPILDEDDRRHLSASLRLRPGDPLTLSDGKGAWRRARFGPEIAPDGPIEAVPAAAPELTVAFALVKGARPELVVQKLTELGVDRIIPFTAARSVVQWDDAKVRKGHARLSRVAREAAMQSRRVRLPRIEPATDFAAVAALPGAVLAQRGGGAASLARPTVLVGPEGGWSDEELAAVAGRVGLGATVLRAETAAIAAAATLTALRAGVLTSHEE
jgi:16S rRNA (uracil1498-N3)-methyltransferase